jgi:hypothetical protein
MQRHELLVPSVDATNGNSIQVEKLKGAKRFPGGWLSQSRKVRDILARYFKT